MTADGTFLCPASGMFRWRAVGADAVPAGLVVLSRPMHGNQLPAGLKLVDDLSIDR
jgi:hypothetical protein